MTEGFHLQHGAALWEGTFRPWSGTIMAKKDWESKLNLLLSFVRSLLRSRVVYTPRLRHDLHVR